MAACRHNDGPVGRIALPITPSHICTDVEAADWVRALAASGELARVAAAAEPAERRLLHRGAYAVCWPVVFQALTRGLENGRGHHRCAAGLEFLQPECLTRFCEDVEACVADLLAQARKPIHNLAGWVRSRIRRATVDGHRRRRGERGAVQRPRMPKWLAAHLANETGAVDDDTYQRWLAELSLNIQTWVGVTATAGAGLWPYGSWAERRVVVTGDATGGEPAVRREVEIVLAAMRRNERWFHLYIERPLGFKQAPVLPAETAADEPARELRHLSLTQPHEVEDALLSELAALAIEAMAGRIVKGEDPRTVVAETVAIVFGAGTDGELLRADGETLDRIVQAVVEIIEER